MKKIKLAVFDMEGTIFRNAFMGKEFPSIWKVLCSLCGPEALEEDAANTQKYYAGGYPGYSAWVIDTLRILKKHGLTKNQFEGVISGIEYFPGVAETFATLKSKGIQIAVISGGLKALTDRIVVEHEIEHCFAAAEFFWNDDGSIRHWNVQPTDFQHKRSVLEILCRDLGIKQSECAFVGDGRNDRDVAEYAALSIGFNPHEQLRDSATILIEQEIGEENLAAVLPPLLQYPFFSPADFFSGHVWQSAITIPSPPGRETPTKGVGNFSASGQRHAFHTFLVRGGLTSKTADSYCSYLNTLCRNSLAISWRGATQTQAFTVLYDTARSNWSEGEFLQALEHPMSGPHGRANDLRSAAKQFYHFVRGGN